MAQLFRLVKYDNLPRQYIHIHMFLICCLISSHDFDGCFISYPSNTCTINHHQYGFVHVAASWSIENPEFLHDLEAGAVTEGVTVTTRGRRNNGDFMGIHWDIWCLMDIYIWINIWYINDTLSLASGVIHYGWEISCRMGKSSNKMDNFSVKTIDDWWILRIPSGYD